MACRDKLTAAAGLGSIIEVFDETPMAKAFAECLPPRSSNNSYGSYRLGLIELSSFIYGHDSLDDLEEFRDDPLFEAALKGEVAAPKTIGDWLRDFKPEHIDKLNRFLSKMSRAIRKQLEKIQPDEHKPGPLHLSIDSTAHEQHGEKIEGCQWNYKGQWALDSQEIFDELGFSHGFELRAGNTKPGSNAVNLINQAFSDLPHEQLKYLSADSAYCHQEVIRAAIGNGAKFTITANDATTLWRDKIPTITNWESWVYTEEERKKAATKKKDLPKIELGWFLWEPEWAQGALKFPIAVKRTWKGYEGLFAQSAEGFWDHYAVVTNLNLMTHSLQQIHEHHNKRGNAENFIKEEKYGFDLLHFPCLSLTANYAFGLLAQVAHNILRWVALVQRPDKPHFSKKLRRKFIYIPGKVVSHARQLFLKIPTRFHEEVIRFKQAWQLKPCAALDTC